MVSQPPVATLLAWLMTRDTIGMKSFKRPLLRGVISGSTSSSVARSPPRAAITILTNPARTRTHLAPSTVHEEVTLSQLSTVCRPSLPSPTPSCTYSSLNNPPRAPSQPPIPSAPQSHSRPHITILSDLEREKREAHPQSPKSILINPSRACSLPSVSQSRSPSHITILSDLEKEKREAHPRTPPGPKSILLSSAETHSLRSINTHASSRSSVRQSCLPAHITIISNPEKEKREAHPRSTQSTKSIQNAFAAVLAPKCLPTITVTPISILKPPTPSAQTSAPAPAPAADIGLSEPAPDTAKKSILLLPDIIIQEYSQGVQDLDSSTGTDTTVTRRGEMLGVPLVDWRGRLDEDELVRYYPQEHANEQFACRLQSMVRSKTRSAAARRRDHTRRRRQAAPTTAPTSPTISLISSRTRI
jgi:hypothetical protein